MRQLRSRPEVTNPSNYYGQVRDIRRQSYWMDAALFAAAGIATLNYGPSGAGAHEAVEWVDLDSVVTSAQVLVETARDFGAILAIAVRRKFKSC
jgi:acetylornithine deacetylase/succinyl-diaminopimelate desuccinylase-like protein